MTCPAGSSPQTASLGLLIVVLNWNVLKIVIIWIISPEPVAALHVYGRRNAACSWGVGVTPSPVPAWLLEQQGCGVRVGQAWGRDPWGTGHGSGTGVGHGTASTAAASGYLGYCLHVDVLPRSAVQWRVQHKVKFLNCRKCGASPRHPPAMSQCVVRAVSGH